MKYARLERLVLLLAGAAILGDLAISLSKGSLDAVEVLAEALLFGVLVCAVHFGLRVGSVAAIAAALAYVFLRLPQLSDGPLTPPELLGLAARIISFGVVGIVGGELSMRLRYSLTRMEGHVAIDDWSRVYNQRYVLSELEQGRLRHDRYGEPISVIVVTLAASLFTGFRPGRHRALVRGVADHIRGDVRMVDEVGRLEDGRFVVVLPHTPKEGGVVVRDRIASGVRSTLGARDESVEAACLSLPEDAQAFEALICSLKPDEDEDQLPSATYRSLSATTLNPAAASTPSADSSSTLNTSIAASPEGSTKQ